MYAAGEGHFEVTKVLIDSGASLEAKNTVSKIISIFSYTHI